LTDGDYLYIIGKKIIAKKLPVKEVEKEEEKEVEEEIKVIEEEEKS